MVRTTDVRQLPNLILSRYGLAKKGRICFSSSFFLNLILYWIHGGNGSLNSPVGLIKLIASIFRVCCIFCVLKMAYDLLCIFF